MRRPPYHHQDRDRLDVKMTPMIDVVFLLLIFFVCTASFQIPEELLPTNLLGPGDVETVEPPELPEQLLEEVVVKALDDNEGGVAWRIDDRPYATLAEVRRVLSALAAIRSNVPVVLDVEGTVSLGDVIDLYDLCRVAGFDTVQFAAAADFN